MSNSAQLGSPVTFVKRLAKQGDYYSIFVPKDLIDSGLVDPEKYYEITLRAVERSKNKELSSSKE